MGSFTKRLLRTTRIQVGHEELRIRPRTSGDCDVHDWPTEGIARRLIQAMRDRHPKGINACPECIDRAILDRDIARKGKCSQSVLLTNEPCALPSGHEGPCRTTITVDP